MDYILLTGATGFVGRYLLRGLLREGIPVAVVVRAGKLQSASDRIDGVMRYWEGEAGYAMPRPVVLEGDLCSPRLGLDANHQQWIADNCTAILHCAASMTFREDQQGEPFRTNVGGFGNVLDLCREVRIRNFHMVSTAYICGLREGRILESDVDLGQRMGNVYEQSKLRAETMARQADFLETLTVLRPASVVGDSQNGYVTSCHGFYLPLHLAHIVANKVHVQHMNERFMSLLGLAGDEGKNLVPVDWLSKAIVAIVSDPKLHGRTYHLASEKPVAVSAIQALIQEAIEAFHPNALKGPGNEDLSAYEAMFQDYMRIYESHWRDDPVFDVTNTRDALPDLPCPELDDDTLLRIARYPIERDFRLSPFEQTKPVFDVSEHLRACVGTNGRTDSCDQTPINLQVNGSGGGQWRLYSRGQSVCGFELGLAPQNTERCYLTSSTMRALVRGERTVEESIDGGRVALEGDREGRERVAAALAQLTVPA